MSGNAGIRIYWSQHESTYTRCLKNTTLLWLAVTSTYIYKPILAILAEMLLRKSEVKWYFIFPLYLTNASELPAVGKHKAANCVFLLKRWMLFCPQTQKTHSCYHSITAEPPLILTRTGRMHYRRPTKGKWKVNGQYWCDILLSQQMLAVIEHVVDDDIICLSATQLMHASAHDACNTVQQLLCRTLNTVLLWFLLFTFIILYGCNHGLRACCWTLLNFISLEL